MQWASNSKSVTPVMSCRIMLRLTLHMQGPVPRCPPRKAPNRSLRRGSGKKWQSERRSSNAMRKRWPKKRNTSRSLRCYISSCGARSMNMTTRGRYAIGTGFGMLFDSVSAVYLEMQGLHIIIVHVMCSASGSAVYLLCDCLSITCMRCLQSELYVLLMSATTCLTLCNVC